jgi:hypothetical protein
MHLGEDGLDPVVDSAQLTRIEATHRGFGYQHLYAVACILSMDRTNIEAVVVEHDEDVELVRVDCHVYGQVKTRNRPLWFSDLNGALPRFAALRREHAEGRRQGAAHFVIVSNTEPGPELRARLAQPTWPADVAFLWPGGASNTHVDLVVPAPWPDLGTALQSCVEQAGLVPFPSLAPETLVFKLAGFVQYLATGHAGHAVTRGQAQDFLEQLVVQLHDFPEPPVDYREQVHEPDLQAAGRVQLVIGVSGAGKTAWASHATVLHPDPAAYFDVGELPVTALATSLARELVARFLGSANVGAAALPAASGLELLALLSSRLRKGGLGVTVVLDNVHRVPAGALRSLVDAAADVRFVLLGQPWPGQAELEARLGIQAESLGGWSLDAVAAAFAAVGCPITAAAGQRVLGLTAGVPLYVNTSARLAAETYAGNVEDFLDAVDHRLALVQTAQEVLLTEAFDQLTPSAKTAAAVLDLSDVALDDEEALELLHATGEEAPSAAKAIRELGKFGVVQLIHSGGIKLHDAYRLLARDNRTALPTMAVEAAREALVAILHRSLSTRWTVGRFGLWVRLLAQTGRQSTLIDVATHEQFHQVGDPSEVKAAVESAARSRDLSDEDRFWALDALVLWEYSENAHERIPDLVDQMVTLAGGDLGPHARASLAMKQMLAAALQGDREATDAAYAVGLQQAGDHPALGRVLQYNRALSLFQLGAFVDAASDAFQLVTDYYADLGLDIQDVFGTTPALIRAAVSDTPERDDHLRHTGDSLDLLAAAQRRLGQRNYAMGYLHALKFYIAASAWRSAVRAGQDSVDGMADLGDPHQALHICEGLLLPVVTRYQLSDLLVPVRAQYAVVLAWCGQVDAAREEMSKLEAYQATGLGAFELTNQRELIERIAAGDVVLPDAGVGA